jgi:cholesterol oxidase
MAQTLGLKFSEMMSGGFALGASDSKAGEQQGNLDGTKLVMNCVVTVDDLDSFVHDPQHTGILSGTVDFAPLGTAIPCDQGIFNLFRSGASPAERWMVYEMGFAAKGQKYYLAGKKIVQHDHGAEVLEETTTLYTVLHEGSDSSRPIVGAGVLHLGVKSMAALARTIQITNAQNSFETLQGLTMYLHLFLGELWHTYL